MLSFCYKQNYYSSNNFIVYLKMYADYFICTYMIIEITKLSTVIIGALKCDYFNSR